MKIIKWVLCILVLFVVVAIGLFYLFLHFSMKGDTEMEIKQTNEVKTVFLHQKGTKSQIFLR
jgi:hypothetical protein